MKTKKEKYNYGDLPHSGLPRKVPESLPREGAFAMTEEYLYVMGGFRMQVHGINE